VSAQPARMRHLCAAFIVAAGALLLAGCAAGQVASTAQIVPVVDGVSARVGSVDLRAVAVSAPDDRNWPAGSSAPLQMYVINNASSADQLVSVSTDQAGSVQLVANGGAAPSSASASSSGSSAPASGSSASSQPIQTPPGQSISVGFDPGNPQVVLTDLKSTLFPANTIRITFQFAQAGSVTLPVPVHLTKGPSSTPTLDIEPTED
jgi:periplasmic copper chaperone A